MTISRCLTLCVLSAALVLPARADLSTNADDANVVAPGRGYERYPLTQGQVDYYLHIFQWTGGFKLNPFEVREFEGRLIAAYPFGRYFNDLPGAWSALAYRFAMDRNGGMNGFKDEVSRLNSAKQVEAGLRAFANKHDDGRWLWSVWRKYRRSIAKGSVGLSRQHSDKLAERLAFQINEVYGRRVATATPAFKAKFARDISKRWTKLPVARRQLLVKTAEQWPAFLEFTWKPMVEYYRERVRADWGREIEPAVPLVRKVSRARRQRIARIDAQIKREWKRMTPSQRSQMIAMQGQMMMDHQRQMARIISNGAQLRREIDLRAHVTALNAIENINPNPRYRYYLDTKPRY